MRRTTIVSLAGFMALAALLAIGCGKKSEKPGEKKVTFKPGKMVTYNNPKLGFTLQHPENMTVSVHAGVVEMKAKGAPYVKVTLHKTQENTTGSSSSGGMGKYRRKVYAPRRMLLCHSDDTGGFDDMVKKICRSMRNTGSAPKSPSVSFGAPKIEGKLKNGEAFKKALKATEPKIVQCWKKAVAADAKFPQGHLNFQLVYKADGSEKQRNLTRTFNYQGHKPLTTCVEKLVKSVKPEPDGGEVKLGWYLKFKLYK